MIYSMTGMGRARGKIGPSFFLVEVKSVNHRYCEVSTRLPSRYQIFEHAITTLVKKKVSRGKIEISLFEEKKEGDIRFDATALKNYWRFLNKVRSDLKIAEPVGLAHLQAGSSLWMTRETPAEKDLAPVKKLVEKALLNLLEMRRKEGANLKKEIEGRLKKLVSLKFMVMQKREEVVVAAKDRLNKRLEKLMSGVEVDPARLAAEVAVMADRSDISEEGERLSSHFAQMQTLMNRGVPSGREIDFLIQEINREWNTMASKSQDAPIAHWVVEAKAELEKIREQIQNIE